MADFFLHSTLEENPGKKIRRKNPLGQTGPIIPSTFSPASNGSPGPSGSRGSRGSCGPRGLLGSYGALGLSARMLQASAVLLALVGVWA